MFNFTKEEAKREVTKLVEDFKNKIDVIKSDKYKEANVEDEFIKPLFKYLNWNISNEGIKNIADREFIVQAKGKGGKEPDYLLQLEGKPYFYIEAKHPKYDLFKEIKYIWQTYSYAYSTQSSSERKKVDFSLLTDFEEFRLFDCTFKADPNTVNNFVTIVDWKYTDYVNKFDLLWQYFEKENVRNGSLKTLYLNEKHIKENRIPPDKAFLDDLDNEKTGWRITLAKDIKKYNPELSSDFITSVIQLIIDRFVFIKVLSDREIEDDFLAQVVEQINKASSRSEEGIINVTCKDLFVRMNKTYNGSIFEERKELDRAVLSNKTLHSILKSLLPENSRYNFKVIPVEILGTIYEQFLGKIVSTTDKRATIEYKPEVRKAGGVYYTPQYIVEYIVENTVGTKLSKCKSINDVMDIKICDPACGSGSFLLGAYDKLITHIADYFTDKVNHNKEITKKERELFYQDNNGNIRLTAKIKRDILRNCIYGVDIDKQAVEVTKMSLSLKALEDTKHDELYNEVNLFHEKVLPDLSNNIKCGNSLIGSDFYSAGLFPDTEEMKKINAFDWEKEFKEIFLTKGTEDTKEEGGFDVVIGNPPYGAEFLDDQKKYLFIKYPIMKGQPESYEYFLFKTLSLCNNNGLISFIVPTNFIESQRAEQLRENLLNSGIIKKISNFRYNVWKDNASETLVIVYSKIKDNSLTKIIHPNTINDFILDNNSVFVDQKEWNKIDKKRFLIRANIKIVQKIEEGSLKLGEVCDVSQGIIVYKTREESKKNLHISDKNNTGTWKKLLDTHSSLERYFINWGKMYLNYGEWLWCKRDEKYFINEKILFIRLRNKSLNRKLIGVYDNEIYYNRDNFNNIIIKDNRFNIKYILLLFNSNLINYWYKSYFDNVNINPEQVRLIPIKNIDNIEQQAFIDLVNQMLEAQKEYHTSKDTTDEHTCKLMKQRIDSIDRQIDQLVYKLYDLTDDEIKIVEGKE